MADVNIIPKIRCDNCGETVDKIVSGSGRNRTFGKPTKWGFMKAEGTRSVDSYGGKSCLDLPDLCPGCAQTALDGAAAALAKARSEGFDGPTGAE